MSCKFRITTILIILLAGSLMAQNGSENPHGAIRWDCLHCHTTRSWKEIRQPLMFAHEETGFPLSGAHQFIDCSSCHQSLKFVEIGTACADCHTDVHRSQFGSDCQNCHTSLSWENQQENFELHASRGFPLVGVHAITDCQACHVGEQQTEFSGTAAQCSSCHAGSFMQTTNPSHARAGFGLDCMSCHTPTARKWKAPDYVHPQVFLLRGAHSRADCNSCHVTSFAGTAQECVSCHLPEYQNSSNPSHSTFGFPQECQLCHNENRWGDAIFDHLSASGFELQGAHGNIQCLSCHVNNQQTGLPRDCLGCHQTDYNNVVDPNHVTGNFPTDCMVCHNQTAWSPASFDHNQSQFPLTGAHVTLQCIDCHSNGYSNTPSDCYSCHQSNYDNTTNPNHGAAGFPTDCQQCHNTSNWGDTTWDHDGQYFPIYSGKHNGKWDTCADCHVNPNNYAVFECIFCHEHTQDKTDPKHQDVAGYQYNSQACFNCHPTGDEKMGLFPNHGIRQ